MTFSKLGAVYLLCLTLAMGLVGGAGLIDPVGNPYGWLKDGATIISGTGAAQANGWPATVTLPTAWWYGRGLKSSHNDGSGGGLNLTAVGAPPFAVNQFNNSEEALSLDGATQYTYLNGANAVVNNIGGTFTIVAAVYPTALTAYTVIAAVGAGAASDAWILQFGGTAGKVRLITYDGAAYTDLEMNTALIINTWNLLIFTLSGGNGTGYLNGAAIIGPIAMNTPRESNSVNFTIGALSNGAQKFTGSIGLLAVLKGTAWNTTAVTNYLKTWHPTDATGIFARWRASALGAVTKLINGANSSVTLGTWGAENAGEISQSANNEAIRYYRATGDLAGSPGAWPQ